MDKATHLLEMARELTRAEPDFQAIRGPGAGNNATNAFMQALRTQALAAFSHNYSERPLCGATDLCVDFYFPEEATIVEVALGLPNPNTEFEKDILKAIVAQQKGARVERLFFISRAGAMQKCRQPGRAMMVEWARTTHGLQIEVHDLEGLPRKRSRSTRPRRPKSTTTRGAT